MANGKRHFLVGGGLALAADILWQQERMAAERDAKFDWGELVLVGGCGAVFGILADILEPATSPNHRRFFHSCFFIALVIWALAMWGWRLPEKMLRFVGILIACYFSHLFLDLLTPRGLPWFGLVRLLR